MTKTQTQTQIPESSMIFDTAKYKQAVELANQLLDDFKHKPNQMHKSNAEIIAETMHSYVENEGSDVDDASYAK